MTDLLTVPEGPARAPATAALAGPASVEVRLDLGEGRSARFRFPTPPLWLRSAVERILQLHGFGEGWDGHDARSMSADALLVTLEVLTQVASDTIPEPQIVMSPEGGLQLEWHQGGWDVEIEARGNGDLEGSARGGEDADRIWIESLVDLGALMAILTRLPAIGR